jgi:hypothetical protein
VLPRRWKFCVEGGEADEGSGDLRGLRRCGSPQRGSLASDPMPVAACCALTAGWASSRPGRGDLQMPADGQFAQFAWIAWIAPFSGTALLLILSGLGLSGLGLSGPGSSGCRPQLLAFRADIRRLP